MLTNGFSHIAGFIWDVADLLRGPYHPNQYKDVMLPLTVLRRLDCVLDKTKEQVLSEYKQWKDKGKGLLEAKLTKITAVPFYNISKYTFRRLCDDHENIAPNLLNYIKGFSGNARNIIEHFGFEEQIEKLDKSDRLFIAVGKFASLISTPMPFPTT